MSSEHEKLKQLAMDAVDSSRDAAANVQALVDELARTPYIPCDAAAHAEKWLRDAWKNSAAWQAIVGIVAKHARLQHQIEHLKEASAAFEELRRELQEWLPEKPAEITVDKAVGRLIGSPRGEWHGLFGTLLRTIGSSRRVYELPNGNSAELNAAKTAVFDACLDVSGVSSDLHAELKELRELKQSLVGRTLMAPWQIAEFEELREFKRKVLAAAGGSQ